LAAESLQRRRTKASKKGQPPGRTTIVVKTAADRPWEAVTMSAHR